MDFKNNSDKENNRVKTAEVLFSTYFLPQDVFFSAVGVNDLQ
jgi:hypothetical protein